MSFLVLVSREFEREFRKLAEGFKNRIRELFRALASNPVPWKKFDVAKIKGREHTYRVRIGRYRIIYEIDKKKKIVRVLKLKLRDERTYKSF